MAQNDHALFEKMGIKPRCPLCRATYLAPHLSLIREARGRYLFHIFCPNCQASILNITMDNIIGTSSLYMVTDLTPQDLERFVEGSPVTCDEVIEAYDAVTREENSQNARRANFSYEGLEK